MLWIALYLPDLALQIASRSTDNTHPLVISSGPDNRPLVYIANEAACAQGIKADMPVAAARALCQELHVVPRQLDTEHQAVNNFAAWASQFTPSVALKNNEGLLLEVSTTLTLHQGLPKLLGRLRQGSHQLGYRVSCGVAPTPLAAWLMAKARYHGYGVRACMEVSNIAERLGELPLALFDWPHDVLNKLSTLGIVRIAEFCQLPAEGVAQRFGENYNTDMQRALGVIPDPQIFFIPPEHYRNRVEFGFELNDATALLFPLKCLLSELEGFLRARGAGILAYQLHLEHSDRSRSIIDIGVSRPERQAERLISLSREHLSKLILPATVLAIAVEATQLHPFVEVNASWLPDAAQQSNDWLQLLDTLGARLGSENVYQLQGNDDFRPERAWKQVSPAVPWKGYKPKVAGVPRPLFLLPHPRKLLAEQGVPLCHGRVDLLAGPERIECGWWDGEPTQRDYYVGRNAHGETMWLYRDIANRHWHLHGYFA